MVATRLTLEPEVQQIFEHIDNGKNFLLSGGAGSGKTYSLVQVIKQAIQENPREKIACMTYTNAAVRGIEERVGHDNLSVTTIHDFLWENIKLFQKELKKVLINLINDDAITRIKSPDSIVSNDYYDNLIDGIQYGEVLNIKDGRISHDELLIVANRMFRDYSLLSTIIKDKFKFIFIDEYQDTDPLVIEIFLVHLKQSSKHNILGFFGDSMQTIYDKRIENLDAYITSGEVQMVPKKQNRRNPELIITLANRLRTDGLVQEPSKDKTAPNMQDGHVKPGSIIFLYSKSSDLDKIKKQSGFFKTWDFRDSKQTKELHLTHNLIAPKAGFASLIDVYDGDKILDYQKRIKDNIKKNNIITDFSKHTFGQVIDELNIAPTDTQKEFIDTHLDLYEEAKAYPWESFSKIYLDKDMLIDDKKQDEDDETKKGSKRDNMIKHLFKIQTNIHLYKQSQYNEFIRMTSYPITSIKDKQDLKEIINAISGMSNLTIDEVIDCANEYGICFKDDKFSRFLEEKQYVYNRIKKITFREFQNLFEYLEGYTPFSTQHKIKGDEFKNVLVVLDNGGWSNYNFEYLLDDTKYATLNSSKKTSYPSILSRTQKIFYVCCTRSKENLIVFYHSPNQQIIEKAKTWFGNDNVHEV